MRLDPSLVRIARQAAMVAMSVAAAACSGQPSDTSGSPRRAVSSIYAAEEQMKISINAQGQSVIVELEDSEAARDFAAMLPLSLTMSDYNRTEKIADLPRPLSVQSEPEGIDPAAGDLTYYEPWGNLAVFYRDFGYSRGLVRLGRIEGDAAQLETLQGVVRIDLLDDVEPIQLEGS